VSALWAHRDAARGLVLGLKLTGFRTYAHPLVTGMSELVARTGTVAGAVVWPPCTRIDRRRRGFDHAEVLARGIAEELGVPALPVVRRVRKASDQAGLGGIERRANLVNAFAVGTSPEAVLLVDDVITTGATLQACAEALRRAGARRIEALVACSAFS
jgi:competence protein ComFC